MSQTPSADELGQDKPTEIKRVMSGVQPQDYLRGHPVLDLMLGEQRSLVRFQLILTVIFGGILLAGWWDGSLRVDGPDVGMLEDLLLFAIYFLLPLMVMATHRMGEALLALLHTLSGILQATEAEVAEEIRRIQEHLMPGPQRRRVAGAFYLIALLLCVFFQGILPFAADHEVLSWSLDPSRPVSFAAACVWALVYLCGIVAPICCFIFQVGLLIFPMLHAYGKRHRLLVIPLAPDGKGGMAVVADLALSMTVVPGCCVLAPVLWSILFGIDAAFLFGFFIYTTALTALFFLPLLSVHRAMKEARTNEMERLAMIFRAEYHLLPTLTTIRSGAVDLNEPNFERRVALMAQIQDLYHRAEQMPVWPFNMETIRRFLSLTVIPAIIFITQVVSENAITSFIQGIF